MTAKKTVAPKQMTKLQQAEDSVSMLESSLYMAYDDYDEMFAVLRYIIDDVDKPDFSRYQVKGALKALRTLMIHNQQVMMDCAGLEY